MIISFTSSQGNQVGRKLKISGHLPAVLGFLTWSCSRLNSASLTNWLYMADITWTVCRLEKKVSQAVNTNWTFLQNEVSHLMTKPTKWLCTQRRLRSAWTSAQPDQSSLCTQWVAKDPSFLHADVPFCWFCHEAAQVWSDSYITRSAN